MRIKNVCVLGGSGFVGGQLIQSLTDLGWEVKALARSAELPGPLHIKALALAPGTGQRPIDVNVDGQISALRADLIGGDHVIHQRLDEGGLIHIEKGVSFPQLSCLIN